MIRNDFYVYEHWRTDLTQCFYVGKGTGKRARVMYNRNRHHKAIQSKLADAGLDVEIVIVQDGLTEDEAIALEISTIARYGMDKLANLTSGGEGLPGKIVSLETRQKMSEAHKGKVNSPEARRKISEANRGRKAPPRSAEWRKAQSEGKKGIPLSGSQLEAIRKGAKKRIGIKRGPMSEEWKMRISEGKRGKKRKPFTEQHKQRMSESVRFAKAKRKQEVN